MTVSGFTRAAPAPPTSPQESLRRERGWIEAFLEMMAAERAAAANTLTAYAQGPRRRRRPSWRRAARDLADARAPRTSRPISPTWARAASSPATAARRRAAVRQFYRFVLGEGWRADDPSRRVDAPKQGRPLPKVLTRDEVDAPDRRRGRRKDGAGRPAPRRLIELIYASGLRVSEADRR